MVVGTKKHFFLFQKRFLEDILPSNLLFFALSLFFIGECVLLQIFEKKCETKLGKIGLLPENVGCRSKDYKLKIIFVFVIARLWLNILVL